jgi:hypothetical protein
MSSVKEVLLLSHMLVHSLAMTSKKGYYYFIKTDRDFMDTQYINQKLRDYWNEEDNLNSARAREKIMPHNFYQQM